MEASCRCVGTASPSRLPSKPRKALAGTAPASSSGRRRPKHVVGRGPVGPGERRREALARQVLVGDARRLPPRGSAEPLRERRSHRVVEQEEVDLVCVLVLDHAPREPAGIEEPGVELDRARFGRRREAWRNANRDLLRHDAPVEEARVQRGPHLRTLRTGPARKRVVAAGRSCGLRTDRRRKERCCDPKQASGHSREGPAAVETCAQVLVVSGTKRKTAMKALALATMLSLARVGVSKRAT